MSVAGSAALFLSCAARTPNITGISARQQTVTSIKQVAKDMGFGNTGNFAGYSDQLEAYYHCYYTPPFELPDSYERLGWKRGTREGCALDESRYDVFFYPMEALAGADTPISTSLEQDNDERFAMVVAHEDFHDASQVRRLPTRFTEAAAMMAGFLTAAEQERRSGAGGERFLTEARVYLEKATLQNHYHELLGGVYRDYREHRISGAEAESAKEQMFSELRAACEALEPEPASFNRCPPVFNNAGLAFDMSYTRFYPLLYELYEALGADASKTIAAMMNVPEAAAKSEASTERYFRDLIARVG